MTTHPNRGQPSPQSSPQPEAIKAARAAAGLTQLAAAELVYSTARAWQSWEYGEKRMHPAVFELFRIKSLVKASKRADSNSGTIIFYKGQRPALVEDADPAMRIS